MSWSIAENNPMNPQVYKAFLRIGVFIAGTALVLMLVEPRDSGEFVVSTCSLLLGLVLVGGVFFMTWMTRR